LIDWPVEFGPQLGEDILLWAKCLSAFREGWVVAAVAAALVI